MQHSRNAVHFMPLDRSVKLAPTRSESSLNLHATGPSLKLASR
jgi:hypothetical protein